MENQTSVTEESLPQDPNTSVTEESTQPQQQEQLDVTGISAAPPSVEGQTTVSPASDLPQDRPIENVAREYQRKFEKTQEELSQMKEVLTQIQQNTSKEEQTYSIADLEAYKQQHPEYAAWCEEEKMKILQKNMISTFREEQQKIEEARNAELAKQQQLQYVAQAYPQMFNKDATGRVTSWNPSNPLTQQTGAYLNQGHSLDVAAKLAYADLAQTGLKEATQVVAKQQADVGDLQRRVAIEGGGVNAGQVNASQEAMHSVKQTGDKKAATQLLGGLLRKTGKIQD